LRVLAPGGHLLLSDIYLRESGVEFAPVQRPNAPHCCLDGATTEACVKARVSAAGFRIRRWEDHSHLLKVLAAQLVFAYGSMDNFWRSSGRPQSGHAKKGGTSALGRERVSMRPGYYLLVGRKEIENG
jgi:hypothetical protein